MPTQTKSIHNLDAFTILAHFAPIRAAFLTKLAFLGTFSKVKAGKEVFDKSKFNPTTLADMREQFPYDKPYFEALELESADLIPTYLEDILASFFSGSWIIFERIIKGIPNPNYSHNKNLLSVDFKRSDFGFTKQEKADLDLIYYIRNSLQHYNGTYYAVTHISHTYDGIEFDSNGHVDQGIEFTLQTAYKMCCDLERLACKAWINYSARTGNKQDQKSR